MKMKKGNAGIIVLVIALFVVVIAMCGVVLYYEMEDENINVEQSNNDEQLNNTNQNNAENNNNNVIVEDNKVQDKDKEETKPGISNEKDKEENTNKDDSKSEIPNINNKEENNVNNQQSSNTNKVENTQTNIEPLTSQDKEYLKKSVIKTLEDYEISGGITKKNLEFMETKMKEEVNDASQNKLIEEVVDIIEAAFITNNGKDFDKVWNNATSESRQIINRAILGVEAQEVVSAADLANAKHAATLAYAEGLANGMKSGKTDGAAYNKDGNIMTAEDYYKVIAESNYETIEEIKSKYVVTVSEKGTPTVEAKK